MPKGKIKPRAEMPEKWYRCEDQDEAAQNLLRWGQHAIEKASLRRGEARLFASLFEGLQLTSFDGNGYGYDQRDVFESAEGLGIPVIKNTVRSIGMTAVAKMTANDTPLAQFMTTDGGWEEQTKAVRMGRMVDVEVEQPQGHFATLHEMHRHGATLAINATGSYMIFFFPGDDGIRAELDDTLTVGIEQAGRFGRITSIVRTVWYDADDLAAEPDFEKFEDEIYANEQLHHDQWIASDTESDIRPRRGVKVVQGWHMQYKSAVGREMWVLQDGTILRDVDYDRGTIPAVKWDYERQLYGLWGVPMTRTIYEMAMRENRMLCDMDNAERNSPQCVIVLPENAEKPGDLDEARGWTIIRAQVPDQVHFVSPPKYNQMSADFVDRMQQACQDISGISNQHSAAQKATGTTSGKHEHLVAALFTERFADQERRLIQARAVDTAKEIVHGMKVLVEKNPGFERVWSRGDKTEKIKPADLDLDTSKYTITVAPVSEDKDTPKARMDKAQEWLEMGLITGTEFASLEQTYATNAKTSNLIAQEEWVEKQIDKWLHAKPEDRLAEDFYQGPNRWIDLPSAMRQVAMAELQARSRSAPTEILEWFDKFLAEASDYMDQQNAQAATHINATATAGSIFPGAGGGSAPAPGAGGPTTQGA